MNCHIRVSGPLAYDRLILVLLIDVNAPHDIFNGLLNFHLNHAVRANQRLHLKLNANVAILDVAPIIDYLKRLPVDCIGIDATETSIDDIIKSEFDYKELALGLVDARSPSLENPEKLAEKLTRVYDNCGPSKLWLTPNTGTEYIGWTLGLEKMKILEKTRECIENEQIISNV